MASLGYTETLPQNQPDTTEEHTSWEEAEKGSFEGNSLTVSSQRHRLKGRAVPFHPWTWRRCSSFWG